MRLLIVGCGYVGSEVAKQFRQRFASSNDRLYALTRSDKRVAELQAQRIEPIVADWLQDGALPLPDVDAVLVAVPHREVDQYGKNTHVRGLRNLLASLGPDARQLIYLSTTGVYGTCADESVDESTPIAPTRTSTEIAVAAEQWLAERLDVPEIHAANDSQDSRTDDRSQARTKRLQTVVLRLAGIYGPGRIPLAAAIRSGEPLSVPRSGHLNLVHVSDVARMICIMLDKPLRDRLYVLSDGQPVIRETFYRELAQLCGCHAPTFVEPEADDRRVRRATDKRVNPSKLIDETGYDYLFPNYRLGLAQSLAEER